MSTPAASVVIPTYQRRELVLEAVHSVVAQTEPLFELIVVDDGSTDGTAEALRGIDPRLVVVRGPRRGVAAARNIGIQRGRAPVVAFLDSDNLWLPDHLATVLEMLERHPDAVLATTCPHHRILGRGSVRQACLCDPLVDSLLAPSIGYTSCVAVRRWALERVESFDEQLPVAEDTDLWVRLAIVGPSVFLRRRTVVRRETPGSLMAWGGYSGAYLVALEHHGNRVAELLAEAPGKEWLAGRARGLAVFARALKALDDGSDLELRALLRSACELYPELHEQPLLVAAWVWLMVPSVSGRVAYACACARCAAAWPAQAALTAHWLREQAVLAAARAGRPDLMASAIRGWRPAGAGRLLLLVARIWTRLLRDAVEYRAGLLWCRAQGREGRAGSPLTSAPAGTSATTTAPIAMRAPGPTET